MTTLLPFNGWNKSIIQFTALIIFILGTSRVSAQFRNTYIHGASDDHTALASDYGNNAYIQVSTVDGPVNKDVHLMRISSTGVILNDVTISSASNNDYGLDIVKGNNSDYLVCGYEHIGLLDIGFLMLVDASFNVISKIYIQVPGNNKNTPALRVINSAYYPNNSNVMWPADPNGGYLVTGFEATGYNPLNSKTGYAIKVNNALTFQWARKFDSTIGGGLPDWDMCSHANWLWTGSFGYMVGGSGTTPGGEQAAFIARLNPINGNVVWSKIYSDGNAAGTYCVSSDGAYDDQPAEVYQLVNFSQIRGAGIVTFNENTGVINYARTRYLPTPSLDYYAYEFGATCAGNQILISGYGLNKTYNSTQGTFPFTFRYDKNNPQIINGAFDAHWSYPVQSTNYNPAANIFDTYFNVFQPRILYPKMFAGIVVNDICMSAFQDNLIADENHVIRTTIGGDDSCIKIDPLFSETPVNLLEWPSTNVSATYSLVGSSSVPNPYTATVLPCTSCAANAAFTITGPVNGCCYTFTAGSAVNACGGAGFTITDPSNNIINSQLGTTMNFCFNAYTNGNYTICFEDCDFSSPGVICRATTCQVLNITCAGTCTPSNPDFTWTVNGCTATFTDLTPDGNVDGCEYWVIPGVGTFFNGDILTVTFPGSGTYNVCHYDCCRPSGQTAPTYNWICKNITVTCTPPCCLPTNFSVTGVQCCRTFTPVLPVGCTPPTYYSWTINGIPFSTSPNPTLCNIGNGVYQICMTAWCTKLNKITICKNIKVKGCILPPPPPCCMSTGKAAINVSASGLQIIFSDATPAVTGYTPLNYFWNFGDGTTSTLANPQHYYFNAGEYEVTLNIDIPGSDGLVHSASTTQKITVVPSPPCTCSPVSPVAYTTSPTVCGQSNAVQLVVFDYDHEANMTYQWMKKNCTSCNGNSSDYVEVPGAVGQSAWVGDITGTSTYVCRCTCNNTGLSSYTNEVVVTDAHYDASVTASPPSVCLGNSSVLSVTSAEAINYEWFHSTETTASVEVSPNATKEYFVAMENSAGCGALASQTVTLDACVAPGNNGISNALLSPTSGGAYPTGNCYNGSLEFATPSPEGNPLNVLPAGGHDVWYKFVASSTAYRFVCTTNTMDVVLELRDAINQVDVENAITGNAGGEIMVSSNLIVGQTYYLAVRSYDGTKGPFGICLQSLGLSACAGGNAVVNLCSSFKPLWTGASSYTFRFVPANGTPGSPTNITSTGQISLSSPVLALQYGGTYSVLVDAYYVLTDAAGNDESVLVSGISNCQITIAPQALPEVKASQVCPATLYRATLLSAKPFVCGAIDYRFEFTEVNNCLGSTIIGSTFTKDRGAASPYLPLNFSTPVALVPGSYYRVRIAPIMPYGPGVFGAAKIIRISPFSSLLVADNNLAQDEDVELKGELVFAPIAQVYPNPNDGQTFIINLTDITTDKVIVRILDNMGRMVYEQQFVAEKSLNTIVSMERTLSPGLYFVEFVMDNQLLKEKMIVQK
jgi:hypothetical protein